LPGPYLLFLGDIAEPSFAKTAFGLAHWVPDRCIGEFVLGESAVTTGLTRLTPHEAVERGARALVIGVATPGGIIAPAWQAALVEALAAGLDIVSGLHQRLDGIPALREAALRHGRTLFDIRVPPVNIPIGTGRKRSGKRLLTVGTDCALGKKYTALALHRAFLARGLDADFRATGQTGIMIAGSGLPMDAVVSDFEAGAAEILSPDATPDHWDVIEGQGSLFNPSFAAVSLGLLHGSQPDVFVVCHDPSRRTMLGLEGFDIPPVEEVIAITQRLGSLTNKAIRCSGISLNTSRYSTEQAEALCRSEAARLGLPVADPVRGGPLFDELVDSCLT
jgi:uncharacterized NAD-dependent epimerase/dehydratase family protein